MSSFIEDTKRGTKDKIKSLCLEWSTLDEYKRTCLIILLYHYLIIKNGIEGYDCTALTRTSNIEHNRVMKQFLNVYDCVLTSYGTDDYAKAWEDAWNNGCVKYILKEEGFLSEWA